MAVAIPTVYTLMLDHVIVCFAERCIARRVSVRGIIFFGIGGSGRARFADVGLNKLVRSAERFIASRVNGLRSIITFVVGGSGRARFANVAFNKLVHSAQGCSAGG